MSQKYRDMKIIEEVKDLKKNGLHVPIVLEEAYREVISRSEISTNKVHYVKVPENHVVIDFDIRGDDGERYSSAQMLKELYSRAISSKLLPDGKLFSVIYKTILN